MLYRFGLYAYFYCAFCATFFLTIVIKTGFNFDREDFWLPLLFITHPVTQLIYITRTRSYVNMRDWKETSSLDDFMTNDMDMEEKYHETSGLMKTLAVLGVIGMGLMVFIGTVNLFDIATRFGSAPVINAAALLSIPTGIIGIIYNVRTFAMKKILDPSQSS